MTEEIIKTLMSVKGMITGLDPSMESLRDFAVDKEKAQKENVWRIPEKTLLSCFCSWEGLEPG